MELNYKQISSELLKLLNQKQREVISRRFGLEGGERETLESIGKDFSVTRERVRQIEGDGFLKLEESQNKYQKVSQYFDQYFKKNGGLKREDLALADLGGDNLKNQVFFLLTLDKTLERLSENEDLYPLWTQGKNYLFLIKKNLDLIHDKLKKSGKPLKLKELVPASQNILISLLEASKKIQKSPEGLYGLKEWPEINPKRIKDKAYLILKKAGKTLHFSDCSQRADKRPQVHSGRKGDLCFGRVGIRKRRGQGRDRKSSERSREAFSQRRYFKEGFGAEARQREHRFIEFRKQKIF